MTWFSHNNEWSSDDFPALFGPKTSVMGLIGMVWNSLPKALKLEMPNDWSFMIWTGFDVSSPTTVRVPLAPLGGKAAVEGAVE
jgi:hypothetical protein